MSQNAEIFSSDALLVINNENTSTVIGLPKSVSSAREMDSTPQIICNELIASPNKSNSLEKLDELSSLEREIAEMHHADDGNIDLDEAILASSCFVHSEHKIDQVKINSNLATREIKGDLENEKNAKNEIEAKEVNEEDKMDVITSGDTDIEHEDLIAVLKGLDGNVNDKHNSGSCVSVLEEGVTIEGEGEYQIMEVVDEDSNATENTTKPDETDTSTAVETQTLNKTKSFGSTILTAQEERALALEQMECLKTAHRRRKQDIKPIKQIDPAIDLATRLETDWNENDETLKTQVKRPSNVKSKPAVTTTSTLKSLSDTNTDSHLITSVVVIPSSVTTTAINTNTNSVPTPSNSLISNVNISSSCTNSSKAEDIKATKALTLDNKIDTPKVDEKEILSQPGFRRTRVIKRKIIWDPDAPETTFSYAKLVKSSSNNKTKSESTLKASVTKRVSTITPIKKEIAATLATSSVTTLNRTQRPTTPRVKKHIAGLNADKVVSQKSAVEAVVIKSNDKSEYVQRNMSPNLERKQSPSTSPAKRRSQTPVANSPGAGGGVKKKKISEVDRLMRDEGAVNMLNSLEKLEANLGTGETKSTRPMMRNRAATICEKFPRKETSPTTTTTLTGSNELTNKGKRTSKSRASSTWDYVYKKKKQDFDDSLIIRRRSNSSYSSTTSLNRSSLDGPPMSIVNNINSTSTKSIDSKSLPAYKTENDLSKTSSTLIHNKNSVRSKNQIRSLTPPTTGGKSFEFAKPENKKSLKRTKSPAATLPSDMKKAAPVASKRNVRSPASSNEDKGKDLNKISSTKSTTNVKDKKDTTASMSSTVSDVVVKKSSKVAQILFSTNKAKQSNTFTMQMLKKLVDILDNLASDPDCHVVVIGTNDGHFCQGIDLTDLITITAEKRKNYAVLLAASVKKYLKTLATYPKPLIAGVNGNLMNLGVIQLALFDVVIASDKTTFETPYVKLGQAPEGYCIWHNMNKIRGSFKTKLFWLCERIQSTEAALAGLVNKLTAANKVNDDAFATARRIANLSTETYRVMKKTVINSNLDAIVNSLDEEFDTIIKQWTSNEYLETLKKYLKND